MGVAFRLSVLLFSLLFISSCKHPLFQYLGNANLTLEGRLIAGEFPLGQKPGPRELFRIDFQPEMGLKSAQVRAVDLHHQTLLEMNITSSDSKEIRVTLPYREEPFRLKKSKLAINRIGLSKCFLGKVEYLISLCLGGPDFSLLVADLSGKTLLHFQGGVIERTLIALEDPIEITLTQAIRQALTKSFRSKFEYEYVIQAHQSSIAAKLNLLPHLRFNHAVGIATQALPLLISSAGDWAPFLFPSQWMKVKEAQATDFATRLSFQVMQANLAFEVHQLAYSLKHNQARLAHIRKELSEVAQFYEKLNPLYVDSRLDAITLDKVLAYQETLHIHESHIEALINADRAALAQTLGYLNPNVIGDLSIDENVEQIRDRVDLDGNQLARDAFEASLELQQVHYLMSSLKWKKVGLFFNWMHPSGSADTALGFNLIPQSKVISSEVHQISHKADIIRQQIVHSADLVERAIKRSYTTYRETNEALSLHLRRLDGLMQRLEEKSQSSVNKLKLEITVYEIIRTYKDILDLRMQLEEEQEKWDLAHAREKRLLMSYRPLMVEPQ